MLMRRPFVRARRLFPSMTTLSLASNFVRALVLRGSSASASLTSLDLSGNKLCAIAPLAHLSALVTLAVDNNDLCGVRCARAGWLRRPRRQR